MYKFLSVMLVAFAFSTPARADVLGFFSSTVGPEPVLADGHVTAPMQSAFVGGSMYGYPFYRGCCEPKSSRCDRLWDGFCASRGCRMKSSRLRHHGHLKGGCGCGLGRGMTYGHSSCGKSGCGGKSSWGHLSYRGLGHKGGSGFGAACGSKGYGTCGPCGPKHHCRLGLFDWLHFGRDHGCSVCGDVGCSRCGGGQGGYMEYAPIQGYDNSYYGTPTEAEQDSTLQPPEVLVEPTSVSDRSAWRRSVPANPFARPFSY